jgi:hypothetical protein
MAKRCEEQQENSLHFTSDVLLNTPSSILQRRKYMRNKVALLLGLSLVLAFSIALMAADQHSGWITDTKCGANGAKAEHAKCALKCAEGGQKLVLYSPSDKKTYALDNQALAKEHIGHEVVVEGAATGESIAVTKIEEKK